MGAAHARPRHPPPRPRRHARVPAHRRHQHLRRARGDLRVAAAQGRARPRRRARHESRPALEQLRARAAAPHERTGRGQRRALDPGGRHGRDQRGAGGRRARGRRHDPHGSPVKRITLEGDRVSGVELESGEKIAAGTVVSNADPATTLLGLLGARHLETGFVHRVRHYPQQGHGREAAPRARRPARRSRGCRPSSRASGS